MANKSEIERDNVMSIINNMPHHERDLCLRMHQSLMLSVGHPVTGNTFMMAIALANCDIACSAIMLGIVAPDGSFKDQEKFGGVKMEVVAVDEAVDVPRETREFLMQAIPPHAAAVLPSTMLQLATPSVVAIAGKINDLKVTPKED